MLVVHGGSSDRKGSVAHAELLARHGYGVLLHDARGRGESDGSENNYGWDWAKDISGALAFLKRQDGVDPERIGALGLSTGADVLIEVAAERDDVKALVADGAAAGSFEDGQRLNGVSAATPPAWLMFTTIRVLSGDPPGPPLEDLIARVRAPTLLISAGTAIERDFNVLYDRGGKWTGRALEPARRPPHRRHPRPAGRLRAARGRVLRPGAAVIAWRCLTVRLAP